MSKRPDIGLLKMNGLLASLPDADLSGLDGAIELVPLPQGEVLCGERQEITHVYFPTTALLSWVVLTENGMSVEAGVTGNEGMAGVSVFLGEPIAPYEV